MENFKLKENERLDDLHRKGYKLIQDPKKFCFGVDAVLLSGFADIKPNETVIDLGTGNGIIPILLEAKSEGKIFYGLEIQEENAEMAKRSVIYNNLEDKVKIVSGDIKEVYTQFKSVKFDVVTSNPPYMQSGGGLVNPFAPKALARHEILCTLDDVVSAASFLLREGGRFYMVHRPHRLADIICTLREKKLEPKTLRFVQPYKDKEPNLVLIEAKKLGGPMIKVLPPLIIYNDDHSYTEEAYNIYYN